METYHVERLKLGDSELKSAETVKNRIFEMVDDDFYRKKYDERIEIIRKLISDNFGDLSQNIIDYVISAIAGYGAIDPLMRDDELEEIMINAPDEVFVFHREKNMCKTDFLFKNKEEIAELITQLERLCGHKIDRSYPLYDGALSDGSRINITLPPVSMYPTITIRKFKKIPLSIVDLIKIGTLTSEAAAYLWMCVEGFGISPLNMIISGGTGTGKTTLLNCLLVFMNPVERVITVEDTMELNLEYQKNWVRLGTAKIGKNEITMEALVINTLRMRPDRIILGEVRGREAQHLLVAMDLGHVAAGTIHANDAREVILRLKSPPMSVPVQLLTLLDLIIILRRFYIGGRFVRRVTKIAEVGNLEGDSVLLGEAFSWNPETEKLEIVNYPVITRDKLAQKTGFTSQEVMNEVLDRKSVLEWMAKNNVTSQDDIVQLVGAYYTNKELVMKKLGLDIKGPL